MPSTIHVFPQVLESEDARLPELLKQEIAARPWFVLCDRPNAPAAPRDQDEAALIQGVEGKVFQKPA